jgi:hypothetical protein
MLGAPFSSERELHLHAAARTQGSSCAACCAGRQGARPAAEVLEQPSAGDGLEQPAAPPSPKHSPPARVEAHIDPRRPPV